MDQKEEKIARIAEFAREEVLPIAAELDEKDLFPDELIARAAKAGLLGMIVPEEYGGMGLDARDYVTAIEEIAKASAAVALTISVNNSLVCGPLAAYGSEEQKERYLRSLASGKLLGSFALTEAGAGSDAASLRTRGRWEGGLYLITGEKMFTTNGGKSQVSLVFARTGPEGPRGITAFIVENSWSGITVERFLDKMGMRGSVQAEIRYEDVRVPAENRLGEEGEGLKIALSTLNTGRLGIAAQCVGIAQAALEASVDYARRRVQFGGPIAGFQAVQARIADMATQVSAARLMTAEAARKKDEGGRFTLTASMAKLFASQTAIRAASDAVYVHGGRGYLKGSLVERLYRDAKVTEIYEGTSDIQRTIIARELLLP